MIVELISCVGLMWILKHGSILNVPRNFLTERSKILTELFKCSLCLGFWSGLIISLFSYFFVFKSFNLIFLPFASSALCWFFDSLLDLIQIASCYLERINK